MGQRHLRVLGGRRHGAVAAVEALQARALVVVPVRRVPVPDELPGELDLVRRVVDVEPRLRVRRAGRPGASSREPRSGGSRRRRSPTERPTGATCARASPRARPPRRARRRGAAGVRTTPRSHVAVGGADERAEDAVRDRRRPERPRVGAERGDVSGDERAEHAEHGEGRAAVDPGAHVARALGAPAPRGSSTRRRARAT